MTVGHRRARRPCVIATPNHLHPDQALPCIGACLPVLIEKPIAAGLADADRIVVASERACVPVLVGATTVATTRSSDAPRPKSRWATWARSSPRPGSAGSANRTVTSMRHDARGSAPAR